MSTQFLRIQKKTGEQEIKKSIQSATLKPYRCSVSIAPDTILTLLNLTQLHTLFAIMKSNQQSIKKRMISFPSKYSFSQRTVSRHNEVSWRSNNIGFVSEIP